MKRLISSLIFSLVLLLPQTIKADSVLISQNGAWETRFTMVGDTPFCGIISTNSSDDQLLVFTNSGEKGYLVMNFKEDGKPITLDMLVDLSDAKWTLKDMGFESEKGNYSGTFTFSTRDGITNFLEDLFFTNSIRISIKEAPEYFSEWSGEGIRKAIKDLQYCIRSTNT